MADRPLARIFDADVSAARDERIGAFLRALTLVGTVTAANYRANAPGGSLVQKPLQIGLTGVKAVPTVAGRAALSVPKATVVGALLPAPVGYVPAEFYGQHPDAVLQMLGIRVGSKPPILNAGPARIKVFEAKQAAEAIAERVRKDPILTQGGRVIGYRVAPGPVPITQAEFEFLRDLPDDVTSAAFLADALAGRERDFTGGAQVVAQQGTGAVVPSSFLLAPAGLKPAAPVTAGSPLDPLRKYPSSASIQPEAIQPVNDAAIRNQDGAKGIRRQLVSERADP